MGVISVGCGVPRVWAPSLESATVGCWSPVRFGLYGVLFCGGVTQLEDLIDLTVVLRFRGVLRMLRELIGRVFL